MARPSDYTQEKADIICGMLSEGKSLRTIIREDETLPSLATIFAWMRTHDEFLKQYTRAKEEAADALADEIQEIVDDGRNDWMERLDKDGKGIGWVLNGEHVARSKLRVEARKWIASKLKPKKYGDKIEVEHAGSVKHVSSLGDDELEKIAGMASKPVDKS